MKTAPCTKISSVANAQMEQITYLDNGATTKIDPTVLNAMLPYLQEKYGNASTIYSLGVEAKKAITSARETIAKSINALPNEIFFTSGGTESNNFALKGIAFANKERGNHIITTKIEHKSILETCKWLEKQGFKISYLNVNKEGFVNLEELKGSLTSKTILVSIIHGNNEIGTLQNLEAIGKLCKENKVYFHTDACQSYTKTEIDVKKQFIDLMSINSHKIHGPKGIGAIYVKEKTNLAPLQHGGGQESNIRSGTENIAGIIGFAEAVKANSQVKHIEVLRDLLIESILKIPHTKLNGPIKNRLCNNVNVSFKFIEGEAIVGYLDQEGICASTGSACSEKALDPSHVLKAIGLSHEDSNGSLRLTLSRFTTEKEIDHLLNVLPKIVNKLREISPFGRKELNVLAKNN